MMMGFFVYRVLNGALTPCEFRERDGFSMTLVAAATEFEGCDAQSRDAFCSRKPADCWFLRIALSALIPSGLDPLGLTESNSRFPFRPSRSHWPKNTIHSIPSVMRSFGVLRSDPAARSLNTSLSYSPFSLVPLIYLSLALALPPSLYTCDRTYRHRYTEPRTRI